MTKLLTSTATVALLIAGAGTATAEPVFNRIASFPVASNIPAGQDPASATSAEIIAATDDGMLLAYSDSPLGVVGLIDIADPRAPRAAGVIAVDGEPTSVATLGGKLFAAVNSSESKAAPSGHLAIIDLASKVVEARCDLGGQPDSIAVSPDRSLLAVAIENERDEDLDDGEIPQLPAGFVAIFPIRGGVPDCAALRKVDLTGLAEIAPEDPEPEFVDINGENEIVVSLQENNHIAIIDGASGMVKAHFSAGTVDLEKIDTRDDGAIAFTDRAEGVRREPDAVKWLDDARFAAANEGDYDGGSRGFTVFAETGEVVYEANSSFEHAVAAMGHYPDGRSDNKGIEPEGMAMGTFGGTPYAFVISERASVIGVYDVSGTEPRLAQILPSGVSPESAVAIPQRDLLVSANEADLGEDGLARAHVMIFERAEGTPAYPQLVSAQGDDGTPIGWGALSGLFADSAQPGILYAVNDSVYGMQPTIYTIDANRTPALITAATPVTRDGQAAQKLDVEGITGDGEGGFWLASEGRSDRLIPHALYHVNAGGEIEDEVAFPAELLAHEARFGSEGVTMVGEGDDRTLWIAIQREWGDDPKGTVKLVSYRPATKEWGAVRYPLDKTQSGWVGLSEITARGDHVYIIERDNLIGAAAKIKKLYRVPVAELEPAAIGGELPLVTKEEVRDLIADLKALHGYVVDKVEGFAIDAAGSGFVVTDNDGVDDSSGETYFFSIGAM
jgi:hypothetical protein